MHHLIRFLLTSFLLLGFLLHAAGFISVPLITQIERYSYDARVRMSAELPVDPRIVILDIDEYSLAKEGQWPWPRDKFAAMLEQLHESYAIRVMGFDAYFPDPDRQSGIAVLDKISQSLLSQLDGAGPILQDLQSQLDSDKVFADALKRYRPVLGMVFKGGADEASAVGKLPAPIFEQALAMPAEYVEASSYTSNLPVLQDASEFAGFFDNPSLEDDGIFRRVPLLQKWQDSAYPSLALALAWRALGQPNVSLEYDAGSGRRTALNLEYLKLGERYIPVDEQVAVLVPYR